MQLEQYYPVLLLGLAAVGFAGFSLIGSVILGRWANKKIKARTTPTKDIAYECGMLPVGEAQPRFSVKFYIVAMLFVLFDIEVVFLYPWSIVYKDYLTAFGPSILAFAFTFALILLGAFGYAWKKGVLDWKS